MTTQNMVNIADYVTMPLCNWNVVGSDLKPFKWKRRNQAFYFTGCGFVAAQ